MNNPYQFDLERAIATWRKGLSTSRALTPRDLDELERHLRDEITTSSEPVEPAFRAAAAHIGQYSDIESEYSKVYWGKLHRRGELARELAARAALGLNSTRLALRNMARSLGYSAINIVGLAIGIAACFLIGLYVADELGFDRYHENSDRLVRITTTEDATVPATLGPALKTSYGNQVVETVRFWPLFAPAKMRHSDNIFVETGVAFVDAEVFDVFSWDVRQGDPETMLSEPWQIVLTSSMALKYFGREDPLGQSITFWGQELTVSGVMADVPEDSHFQFDFLVSIASLESAFGPIDDFPVYTYALLQPGGKLNAALEDLSRAQPVETHLQTQPITDIHLHSFLKNEPGRPGNTSYLWMLGTAALLVLVLASVNFLNLTTVRSAARVVEIGMRRVMGAAPSQLALHFLTESVLLCGFATLGAGILVALSLPMFNSLAGKHLQFGDLSLGWIFILATVLPLVLGGMAGMAPSTLFSRANPTRVLKDRLPGLGSSRRTQNVLVTVQLMVAMGLAIGSVVVYQQLRYMQAKDLGFDDGQVLVLDGDRYPELKEALLDVPAVSSVAAAPRLPGDPFSYGHYDAEGLSPDTARSMLRVASSLDYIETMGLRLEAGRSFSADHPDDLVSGFVLNESAIRALGWESDQAAVGKSFSLWVPAADGEGVLRRDGRVIGVVEDFNYASLRNRIEPVVLYPGHDLNYTLVRLESGSMNALMDVRKTWGMVNTDAPFNPVFLDELLQRPYQSDRNLRNLFAVFTGLALLIAALGLIGLAAFSVQERRKEIGIRKALGASVGRILVLLTRDIVVRLLVAFLLTVPIAWAAMHAWLETFAYRVDMGPLTFLVVGGVTFLVVMLAISAQTVRAATADPVRSLRHE